jgi:predicted ArsR family transcriptional regulator
MPYTDHNPASAGFKAAGTSAEAARHARISAKVVRARVVAHMARSNAPVSADETAEAIGMSILTVRPRFSEMHKDGTIYDTGERGINTSGRSCSMWRLTSQQGAQS